MANGISAMQVGHAAAAAGLASAIGRGDSASRLNAGDPQTEGRANDRAAAGVAEHGATAPAATTNKRDGREQGQDDQADVEQALIEQALDVLGELAKLDPSWRRGEDDDGGALGEDPVGAMSAIARQGAPEGAAELFDLFQRMLAIALERMGVIAALASGEERAALATLERAGGPLRAAQSWWRARVAERGAGEAQLQELKTLVDQLSSHAHGLIALAKLSGERGQAMRALMSEVDVLQRLLLRAVDARRHAVGDEPLRARSTRYSQTLDRWAASAVSAERSVKLIQNVYNKLSGVASGPAPLAPTTSNPAEAFEKIARQLDYFASDVAPAPADPHQHALDRIAQATRTVAAWPQLPASAREEWGELEAIASLLQLRIGAAGNWLDREALTSIARDLKKAVRLAAESLRMEEATAWPSIARAASA